jgi:hypothetical protein
MFFILIANIAFATTPSNETSLPIPDKHTNELQNRVIQVENQLSIIRDYNDDFMSVILWSLGTVAGIALILIGFNWFQSTRTLKAEFGALKEEFMASLNKTSEEQNTKLNSKISGIEKEIASVSAKVVDEKLNTVRGNISWLSSEIRELQYKNIESAVKYWQERSVPANAVTHSGDLISCAIRMDNEIPDNEWRISDAVDILQKSLDLLIEEKARLDTQELTDLEAIVNQLPKAHKTARAVLLSRLQEMHKGQ